MSHRFGPPLITGAHVHGNPGLGVLAELVPSTGEHGPGIASTWLGPAEAGKEVRVLITQLPEVGSLFVWEDTSFEYNGPGGTAYAQLYVEGQPVDTPQTVTVTVGSAADLAGDAVAQSLATADLSTESAGLSGAAQASATAMGLLGTAIPLAGEATATASASGTLGVPVLLSGAAAAVSSATGELTVALSLEGHSLAIALASGSLTTAIPLSGAAVARALAGGSLSGGAQPPTTDDVYPSYRTITVPSGRTITLRPR